MNIMVILFWVFIYIICGCFINALIINGEAQEANKKGEDYIIIGWRWKEVYQIFLWPIAFIEYVVKSWKKLKESD